MPESIQPTTDTQPTPQDNLVTTHHTIALDGQSIAYTVTAGAIML